MSLATLHTECGYYGGEHGDDEIDEGFPVFLFHGCV